MMDRAILRVGAKLLAPFILLFALYVQFHGEYGPGGGFQAGVIFGSMFILYALVFGTATTRRVVPGWVPRLMMVTGLLIYAGTGIASILLGGAYLDYSVLLNNPAAGQHLGIALIELGVGMNVAGAVIAIFLAFAARER